MELRAIDLLVSDPLKEESEFLQDTLSKMREEAARQLDYAMVQFLERNGLKPDKEELARLGYFVTIEQNFHSVGENFYLFKLHRVIDSDRFAVKINVKYD